MTEVHVVLGVAVVALSLAAGLLGAWRWWQVEPSPWFWRLLRACQAALLVEAILGGVLLLLGERIESLHYVYGLVPLLVSFLAEQLRIGAADQVLEARGLADARAVGTLPPEQQESVVRQIVRRELGVMTIAAFVVFGLTVRAALGA